MRTFYYLEKMGIERWVLRSPRMLAVQKVEDDYSLMILNDRAEGLFEGRVGVLFRHMLQSIGVLPEQVYVMARDASLDQEIARIKPRVILAFKKIPGSVYANQMVVSEHPAHLLQYPVDKKKAYIDLLSIQKRLSVCRPCEQVV